jgi:hypothetical protein
MTSAPSEFAVQYQTFITYVYPAMQMVLWLVLMVLGTLALRQFKRLVDFRVGGAAEAGVADESVSVEDFEE